MSIFSRQIGSPMETTADARPGGALDASLVARILAGDRRAEELMYRRHAPGLLRLATRLLRSDEDAMDILQDTFVIVFEEIADLREPAAFGAWVHRVAVRLVHRRFRRRKLLRLLGFRPTENASLESLADPGSSPESRAELRWLDQALLGVDAGERVAWMLRHIEGLALEEVAAACECSLATVKRRLVAADAVVQQHLSDSGLHSGGASS